MNEKNVSWDDLRMFLAVAREGGLSGAARTSGSSPATLSRRMLALERAMGQTLFVRHDRGYALTADGQALLRDLSPLALQIENLTTPPAETALPSVKISAGSWTTLHLLEHFQALAGTPPDLRVQFVASEQVMDMPHRAVTIGFRNARPQETNLAGRKILSVDFAAYATETAPDLWIKVVAQTPSARWLDKRAGPDVACEVTAPRNSLDLALAGVGKAILPTFIGDRYPTLGRRGQPISELSHDQWIVTHQDDRHLPEVRRVLGRIYRIYDVT